MTYYLLIIKDKNGSVSKFTIPKENIKALALEMAINRNYNKLIKSYNDAIEFLNSINIEVENCKKI